jgi:hypothetical protein
MRYDCPGDGAAGEARRRVTGTAHGGAVPTNMTRRTAITTSVQLALALSLVMPSSVVHPDPDPLPTELTTSTSLGVHTIKSGEYRDFGDLRLWVGVGLVPDRVGSSPGRPELYLRGGILPLDEKGKIPASFRFDPRARPGSRTTSTPGSASLASTKVVSPGTVGWC